jgi:hypothetical protein
VLLFNKARVIQPSPSNYELDQPLKPLLQIAKTILRTFSMYGQNPKRKKQPSKQTETKTAPNSATEQLTGGKKTELTGQSRAQAVQRRNNMELSGQKRFF